MQSHKPILSYISSSGHTELRVALMLRYTIYFKYTDHILAHMMKNVKYLPEI